jgi:wyosine [tRNA(Phe)-imidazoG37] synthetase (radical SAM superfamily)
MTYIFGPVQSRRLGRSLGIDLFPGKICNLNCIYCEVGTTAVPVGHRAAFSPAAAILAEIDAVCADAQRMAEVDVVTVTAKGEPTLHSDLGRILRHLKTKTAKPVAVLTNGTTLMQAAVREALMAADVVIPSLDAAREESFRRVDRPIAGLRLDEVIAGLTLFSHAYRGQMWLEILLVRDVNDSDEDLDALVAALRPMRIDRIQLNTVVRPPAESFARPLARERLLAIAGQFQAALGLPVDLPFEPETGEPANAPAATVTPAPFSPEASVQAIKEMLQRRPCTAADIDRTFHLGGPEQVEQLLEPLVRSGILLRQDLGGERFYQHSSSAAGVDGV